MSSIIEQLITKMGLHDEPNVLGKTTELMRLLELRSINVPLQINEYGKIVLCIDMASAILSIGIDKEHALKLSGLRKSHYANHKRMFEKLLDINRLVGVRDICIQLDLNDVTNKANELLELYKKIVPLDNGDNDDIAHPQYAAMAVYFACKLGKKKKIPKGKLMPFSNLKPTQWQQLEQRWEKFITKHYNDSMDNKLKKQNTEEQSSANVDGPGQGRDGEKKPTKCTNAVEDYEKWKKRILEMAEQKLRGEMATENNVLHNENMILA